MSTATLVEVLPMSLVEVASHKAFKGVSGVYVIKFRHEPKHYVGQSTKIDRRLLQHISTAVTDDSNNKFYNAMRKHGILNYDVVEVVIVDNEFKSEIQITEELTKLEAQKIAEYNSIECGYNTKEAGPKGLVSPEGREHMSCAQLASPVKGNAWLGRRHKEESKKKQSIARKGKPLTESHKANIAKAMIGNTRGTKWHIKHKNRIGGEENYQKKILARNLKIKESSKHRRSFDDVMVAKIANDYETGQFTMKELATKYNTSKTSIARAIARVIPMAG